jgi:hypothetical protein
MSDFVLSPSLAPIVHPLDDRPEQKLFRPELGRMRMTLPVRLALLGLRAYLLMMLLLLGWHMFTDL